MELRKIKFLGSLALKLAATLLGIGLFLYAWGWLFRPEVASERPAFDQAAVAEAKALRSAHLDEVDQVVNWVDTDYGAGADAVWYPKEEAPLLGELVESGVLASVEERVGPEPVVLRGLEADARYGGTLFKVMQPGAFLDITSRYSGSTLARWSAQGYPVVPHVAKSWEVGEDSREFTFHLRRGMRWSDGHPFTADDILYFWEAEILDPDVPSYFENVYLTNGVRGQLEKLDTYSFKITFESPNVVFLERLATAFGAFICDAPKHYLEKYHPNRGDPELIAQKMAELDAPSPNAMYLKLKDWSNPEHPRLWPWVYRTYKTSPPQVFVRNPYYFAVDEQGRQLPYIDQIHYEARSKDMGIIAVSGGEVSIYRELPFDQYTMLMSQRENGGYDLYHWYSFDTTEFLILPNHNHMQGSNDPEGAKKRALFQDKRFRQALSLSIDRERINRAEFSGLLEPSQLAPAKETPFYEPSLFNAYVQFEPERANDLLDQIGLSNRDSEGMRTFKDGSRMQFYLDYRATENPAISEMVVEDWRALGLQVVARNRAPALFQVEQAGYLQDLIVTRMNGKMNPLIDPKNYVPTRDSDWAKAFGLWYSAGGLRGNESASRKGAAAPPPDSEYIKVMKLYEEASNAPTREEQIELFREVLKIAAEQVWTINIGRSPPTLMAVDRDLKNVPQLAVMNFDFSSPANVAPETFFFETQTNSEGVVAAIQEAIANGSKMSGGPIGDSNEAAESAFGGLVRWVVGGILAVAVLLLAVRHPFIGRRLAIMVPTLFVVSIITFTVVQLPPGDYLTSYIYQLESNGEEVDQQQVEELREMFELDKGVVSRYLSWMGFKWFFSFDSSDRGLLQGEMGRSMKTFKSVNEELGDRLLLTMAISVLAILFTWVVALPIGVYSAVRQYSIGDYVATFVGFVGMCVPNFLLALILMYVSMRYFDMPVSGLFSVEYASEPGWSAGKVWDLIKHIWVPILVVGIGSTAWMIRVMRANLLDELKKPYVTTARAKGVRPLKLLIKYPIRIALNPFVSSIGSLFPQLVSGGAIVALILSLPTIGPLLLDALQTEDMYLAGSMLMLLSLLGILGTLVSDLLLLALDPRIRLEGGKK